ncbi:hypothetical protein SAMN05444416_103229 [Thermoactinomyces sp. DSM 45892]|nr:hypothetical protein SAMN05444416_103229 [Thermoactinomyces sp. DSM 45892]
MVSLSYSPIFLHLYMIITHIVPGEYIYRATWLMLLYRHKYKKKSYNISEYFLVRNVYNEKSSTKQVEYGFSNVPYLH